MPYANDNSEAQERLAAFLQKLKQLGWDVGHNLQIDYRWNTGDPDFGRKAATELVTLSPDVILATATTAVAALQPATRTVPIVFDHLVAVAAKHSVPTIYWQKEFAAAGGLASYGPNFADAYRLAGIYAGRVLKGEKPADLPVVQPSKFDFVINLKTAKTLGLDVPMIIQMTADEVIE
jgi:putative ABC transport system substrate-binding protein